MIGPHIDTPPRDARPHPILRRVAGATAAVLATGVCVVPATALAAPAPAPACATFTTVLVPGTGETRAAVDPNQPPPATMLAPVARALQARYGHDLAVDTVSYPASISPTYAASESAGAQALSSLLSKLCSTTRVILLGYSQGGQVAGDLATRIGHGQGPVPASRVLAVGLVADPHRAASTPQLGESAGGEGVEGPRTQDFGQLDDRVRTVCARGDLYCSTSPRTDPVLTTLGHAFTNTPTPTTAPGTDPDSTPPSQSGPTANGLQSLDAATLTQQVLTVLAGMSSLAANLPAIGADLAALPQRLAALDAPGAHQLAADLNNQLHPLVTMAAQVDLSLVARLMTVFAPADPSGLTSAAAQIVQLLAGVDINRVATDLGNAQETAWAAVQKLTTGDVLGAGAALTGLIPVAADLAGVAANALTGSAAAPLTTLAAASTATAGGPSTAVGDLARQGADAVQFFASQVHQNGYSSDLKDLIVWLDSRLDQAR